MSWPRLLWSSGIASGSSRVPLVRELDHAAVIAPVDERLDAGARRIGRRVDVREQPDRGRQAPFVAGSVAVT